MQLSTIDTPRRKRKAAGDVDPYDPVGVHAGSFLLYPTLDLIGGYDTNPARVPGGHSSALTTAAPALRMESLWSRHELKADLRGSYTWYKDEATPKLSRPYLNGSVIGRVDVSHDTRIDLGGRLLVSTDNPGSPNLQAGLAKLPIFTSYGGTAGVAHRFNRVELGVKGDIERTVYQNSTLTDGSTASNADRNYNQYGGALRAAYELSPALKPFVEAGADQRVHDLAVDVFGYQRDSKGVAGRLGTSFEMSRLLTGDISVGYVSRNYVDPRLERLQGFIGDASLIWYASALTTAKFTAKSTVGESTVPGISGVLYRDAGLQVDHTLRRWLIGTVSGGVGLDDYVGFDRTDKRYYIGAGLTYKLDRSVQLKGEFRQQWLHSSESGHDYTASIFLIGIRLQR